MRSLSAIGLAVCVVLCASLVFAGGARSGDAVQDVARQDVAPAAGETASGAASTVPDQVPDQMPDQVPSEAGGEDVTPVPATDGAAASASPQAPQHAKQEAKQEATRTLPVPPPADEYGDLLTLAPNQTLRLAYAETTRGETTTKRYTLQRHDDGYRLRIDKANGESITLHTAADFATFREEVHFPATSDEAGGTVTIERTGGPGGERVVFSGTLRGEISETKKVGVAPWYGSTLLLARLVTSGKKNREFYLSEAEDGYFLRLEAIREKRQTVTVNGTPVEAVKVRVTMPDFRRVFWSSYYWFRASDGLLLKSEEVRGKPGTPTTDVVLDAVELDGPKPAATEAADAD